jgi:hypothetical protein
VNSLRKSNQIKSNQIEHENTPCRIHSLEGSDQIKSNHIMSNRAWEQNVTSI